METAGEQVIGKPGLKFTFSKEGACITLPDITLQFESSNPKESRQKFVCSELDGKPGNLSVTVVVAGYDSDLRFLSEGFYSKTFECLCFISGMWSMI